MCPQRSLKSVIKTLKVPEVPESLENRLPEVRLHVCPWGKMSPLLAYLYLAQRKVTQYFCDPKSAQLKIKEEGRPDRDFRDLKVKV